MIKNTTTLGDCILEVLKNGRHGSLSHYEVYESLPSYVIKDLTPRLLLGKLDKMSKAGLLGRRGHMFFSV